MKLFFKRQEKTKEKSKTQEIVKQGREQFKKLVEKGLNIPVAFL